MIALASRPDGITVAIDARSAQRRPHGGVGRAVAATAALMAPDLQLLLLTDRRLPPVAIGIEERALTSLGPAISWLEVAAPTWLALHRPDVFHCPWYGLPHVMPTSGVATIHDLTFEHHPEWFSRLRLQTYRLTARKAAATGKMIVAPSRHVLEDIVRTYRVPPDRVAVVPNAVDAIFTPTAACSFELPLNYMVAIAGAPRRRIDSAVAAWRRSQVDCALVVVGRSRLSAQAGLVELEQPSDSDWAGILAGAQALIYPTEYEGFGLPPLEAAATGTPTVAARVGALPEVMGDAAVWSDSLAVEDLAAAIRRIDDGAGQRALTHAQTAPSWGEAARKLVEVYRQAAG